MKQSVILAESCLGGTQSKDLAALPRDFVRRTGIHFSWPLCRPNPFSPLPIPHLEIGFNLVIW
jgi:hypothetical protein